MSKNDLNQIHDKAKDVGNTDVRELYFVRPPTSTLFFSLLASL